MQLTASLVLYKNSNSLFDKAIASFIDGSDAGVLYVVDNSPTALTSEWFSHERVHVIHAGCNLGFGAGHNLALRQIQGDGYHLLLNPDIEFGPELLPSLCAAMEASQSIAAVMPRIVYPDGSLQHLCKLLPSPLDLFVRRFMPSKAMKARLNAIYELHGLPQDRTSEVPSLSGCLLMSRTRDLRLLGGFDERYFMYMEDVDLVRRLGDLGSTCYVPSITATHAYAKGSYRNRQLMRYHLKSAIKYFNKWGWVFDATRRHRNRQCRQRLGV